MGEEANCSTLQLDKEEKSKINHSKVILTKELILKCGELLGVKFLRRKGWGKLRIPDFTKKKTKTKQNKQTDKKAQLSQDDRKLLNGSKIIRNKGNPKQNTDAEGRGE